MWRRVTLFPVPDGPISTVISPLGIRQLTPSSTLNCPNALCTSRSSITASFSHVDCDCVSGLSPSGLLRSVYAGWSSPTP